MVGTFGNDDLGLDVEFLEQRLDYGVVNTDGLAFPAEWVDEYQQPLRPCGLG